jgi:hypothetical protein
VTKRSRGSRRSHSGRPGTRPQRDRSGRAIARPQSQLRAAEEIAEDVVEGRPASAADRLEQVPEPNVLRRSGAPNRARLSGRPSAALAARAATEYVYVAQDVRRIALVAALLFGILFALWILVVVARVIPV